MVTLYDFKAKSISQKVNFHAKYILNVHIGLIYCLNNTDEYVYRMIISTVLCTDYSA